MKKYKVIENGIEYNIEEYSNGDKIWYKQGLLHREDGAAKIFSTGENEYWLNGIYYPNVNSLEELQIEINNLIIKEIIE